MKTLSEQEARENFDSVLAAGRGGPVEITRDGERVGIFLSDADAELIEDLLLIQKTAEARKEGTVGVSVSEELLARLRNAPH